MKKIIDEFSELPVSNARKRQLRARRDNLCVSCGKPVCSESVQFCTYHLHYRRNYETQKRHVGSYSTSKMVEHRETYRQLMAKFKTDMEVLFDQILSD